MVGKVAAFPLKAHAAMQPAPEQKPGSLTQVRNGLAGAEPMILHRQMGWKFRAGITVKGPATSHRQSLPSCCTCALAMLAKPRF
jgi:hypothetical protein